MRFRVSVEFQPNMPKGAAAHTKGTVDDCGIALPLAYPTAAESRVSAFASEIRMQMNANRERATPELDISGLDGAVGVGEVAADKMIASEIGSV